MDARFLTGCLAVNWAFTTEGWPGRDNPSINGYVDIHAHLLPGIDDGPSDLEQSVAMAQAAIDAGISTIAATPHLRGDFPDVLVEEIAPRCEALQRKLETRGIPLQVVSGAEVSVSWALEASDEHLRLASYGQRGRDLLVESPLMPMVGIDRFLYLLHSRGYRLTLAHPERCPDFHGNEDVLRALVQRGLLLQLNADSLLGADAGVVKRFARRLLTEGLAQAIASDGHRGSTWRPVTRLRDAVDAAGKLVGPERAQWMATTAPAAIAGGKPLPEPPALRTPQRHRWLRRLR